MFISGSLVLFDVFEDGAVGLVDVAGGAVLAGDGVDSNPLEKIPPLLP